MPLSRFLPPSPAPFTDRVTHAVAGAALLAALVSAPIASPQAQRPPAHDPFRLTEPRSYKAFRSSSNNADHDSSATPSVDAPLGDFFGVRHGMERPLTSVLIRNSSAGRSRNEYWPMPFHRSPKATITSDGRRRVTNLYHQVDWSKYKSLPANTPYFHARCRQALPTKLGAPYEMLHTKGRGHYVGTVFSVVQNQPGWFGEGDDYFYVDGKSRANIEGPGTEDYFNDARSLRVADGPNFGVTVADGTDLGSCMMAYRWHVADPIPFTRELRFDVEHAGGTYNNDGTVRSAFEEREDLFSTVAFWYQQGIATGQPEPPYGTAHLPHGIATQIEVERQAGDAIGTRGKFEVQKEVIWGKDILFLAAEGVGARVDISFDVPEDGHYGLIAQMAGAPDYGTCSVLIDGKIPGSGTELEHEPEKNVGTGLVTDGYYTELFVREARVLGWPHLTKDRHDVTFTCTGRNAASSNYFLGIDALVLARVVGDRSAPAADSATTTDAADRLRTIGGSRTRAIADAFGAIGPEARDALPVLEALAKGTTVRWNAVAAIKRVKGSAP
jgi:hypothetical protein